MPFVVVYLIPTVCIPDDSHVIVTGSLSLNVIGPVGCETVIYFLGEMVNVALLISETEGSPASLTRIWHCVEFKD